MAIPGWVRCHRTTRPKRRITTSCATSAGLRAQVGDDKDLARELQDLVQKAQQLDPRHMTNEGQLAAIVGAQAMSEVDEVELVLRRKLQATDGSVRSTNPRNTPPGYADSVAEYYKRLSQ